VSRLLKGLKRANEKGPAESSIPVRGAVLAAVVVAAHATLQQGVGGPALWFVAMVGIPAAFVFSYVMRERPGFLVKLLLAIGMVLSVMYFFSQASGSFENVASLTRPLAELFLLTQLLHSFDVPTRRDLRFSLVSSLTLIAIGGILSISAAFALNLALWTVAAITALVLMERSQRQDLPRPERVATTPSLSRRRLQRPRIAPISVSVGLISVLAAAVFLVLPASGTSRSLTFPAELPDTQKLTGEGDIENPTLANNGGATGGSNEGGGNSPVGKFGFTGFSKELDTSLRGRPDDTIVMRVRASKPAFWRGQSFDTWNGRTWTATTAKPKLIRGTPIEVPPIGPARSSEDFVQTFYLRTPGPNLVFAADRASRVYFPDGGIFVLPDGTMRSGVALDRGAIYTVVSHRPTVTEAALADPLFNSSEQPTATLPPEDVAKYLQLPATTPQRVRDLARTLTADAGPTITKVRALEKWMGDNLQYSLDIPKAPKNSDAVDQFLFVDKIGFCEQIASSLVVMLRSLGIPARLTVGYTPGERNPLTGLYEVKASNAHAWTEVWFPNVGWLPFDPTESVPFADDQETPQARDGLAGYLGSRLPMIFSMVLRVGGAMAAVALAVFGVVGGRRLLRRRQARRARSWSEQWHDNLDRRSRRLTRPRTTGETARHYLDDLGLLQTDPTVARSLAEALGVVEQAAYGRDQPGPDEREAADAALRLLTRSNGPQPTQGRAAQPRQDRADAPPDERQPVDLSH
jgi:protein-glutamine gamma-glutamyltransferase